MILSYIADKYALTREEQDGFAAASQQRAEAAIGQGFFEEEITPVEIPQRRGDPVVFGADEFPKKGVTAEGLAKLRPAFKKDGTVTAANASWISRKRSAASGAPHLSGCQRSARRR